MLTVEQLSVALRKLCDCHLSYPKTPFLNQKPMFVQYISSHILSTITFSGRLVKTPTFFKISLCRYCWSKKPLKLEKWLSLLVDFGEVSPGGPANCHTYTFGVILLISDHHSRFVTHSLIKQTYCRFATHFV